MASLSERSRSNVRAGIFVMVSLLLAVATIIVLTNALDTLLRPKRTYTVTFTVEKGVKNIKGGAEVRVGGVLMGRVKEIIPRIEPDVPLEKIDIVFSLDRRVTLYSDAQVLVTPALIGADAWLEVNYVGTPGAGPVTGALEGFTVPAGAVATLLGADNARKTDEIVENARVMVAQARDAVGDVRRLAGRITDEDWPRWSSRIDRVMDWAVGATEKFDVVLEDGRATVAGVRGIVTDNRPRIDDTFENFQEITRRLRVETVDKVNSVLDTGQKGLDRAVSILEKVDREFDGWAPEIRETLAGLRQTSQQLKLASVEVRRSPWKLLYRPDESELEHELLYEAARSFAMAVSDLRAAADSTERLVNNHGEQIAADPELRKRVNDFLAGSLERYQGAQQKLIDVLLTDKNGPR